MLKRFSIACLGLCLLSCAQIGPNAYGLASNPRAASYQREKQRDENGKKRQEEITLSWIYNQEEKAFLEGAPKFVDNYCDSLINNYQQTISALEKICAHNSTKDNLHIKCSLWHKYIPVCKEKMKAQNQFKIERAEEKKREEALLNLLQEEGRLCKEYKDSCEIKRVKKCTPVVRTKYVGGKSISWNDENCTIESHKECGKEKPDFCTFRFNQSYIKRIVAIHSASIKRDCWEPALDRYRQVHESTWRGFHLSSLNISFTNIEPNGNFGHTRGDTSELHSDLSNCIYNKIKLEVSFLDRELPINISFKFKASEKDK